LTGFFSALFRGLSKILPLNLARWIRRLSKSFQRNAPLVRERAISEGKRRGFDAVTCGHTHQSEISEKNGIRYFNTGTWTEKTPCPFLWIKEGSIGIRYWPMDNQQELTFQSE
jgi:UDP-2,3-diacylglucosamine pyrophosphatase LpxH